MTPVFRVHALWLMLLAAAAVCPAARAVQVWMPETGEVTLEGIPRDSHEQRWKHALALIGTGEWASGVAELQAFIEADPGGARVAEARLAIARALLAAKKHKRAFAELDGILREHKGDAVAETAAGMQFDVARSAATEDVGLALSFYDRLLKSADTAPLKAFVMKERADALFEAGRYLDAEDSYLTVIQVIPDSEWVPYCWYRLADCRWRMAEWLGLGLEWLEGAERDFAEFIGSFPGDPQRGEAIEKLKQVRQKQAEVNAQIARFYIEVEQRPWAAVSYLTYLRDRYKDTPEAKWAAEELERIKQARSAPLRGEQKTLAMPGVEPVGSERRTSP